MVIAAELLVAAVGAPPAPGPDPAPAAADALLDRLMQIPGQIQVLQSSSHNKQGRNGDAGMPLYKDAKGDDVIFEGGGQQAGAYPIPSSYSMFHPEAPILFFRSMDARIQHGGMSDIRSNYRSLAFCYLRRTPALRETDFLDVGNTETYRRQLPDGKLRRKLERLANRLLKVTAELERLFTPEK